jgi:hypothetical protein
MRKSDQPTRAHHRWGDLISNLKPPATKTMTITSTMSVLR